MKIKVKKMKIRVKKMNFTPKKMKFAPKKQFRKYTNLWFCSEKIRKNNKTLNNIQKNKEKH